MADKPKRVKVAGRQKGTPNKATANAREAIARFIDGNADRLQRWLDAVERQDGPAAAIDCYMKLVEYHVPKLARTVLTGEDGGPIGVSIVRFSDPTPQQMASTPLSGSRVGTVGTGLPPRGARVAPT